MYKFVFKTLILAVTLLFITSLSHIAQAWTVDESCAKVEIVFARGSGSGSAIDSETDLFVKQITRRLSQNGANVSSHSYALGTEMYGGAQYRHVAVGKDNIISTVTTLDAITSGDKAGIYNSSVASGVKELESYITQRAAKCWSAGSYFVLGGYSQGAQVVGQALPRIPERVRDRIVFVGLFGDPKIYLPEGKTEGVWPFLSTPACTGKNLSLYRRVIARCDLMGGSLGARTPDYLPDDMNTKTGTWCIADDFVCRSSRNVLNNSGHEKYKADGGSIDAAAQEAATRIQHAIANEPKSSPTPQPNLLIDTTHKFGDGFNGQDAVFVVDRSSGMTSQLPALRQRIKDVALKIEAAGGHFSIASYCTYNAPGYNTPSLQVIPFDYPYADYGLDTYITLLTTPCQYSIPRNDILDVLQRLMYYLSWHEGAAKSITVFTNSTLPIQDPTIDGLTSADIAKLALSIDPVNIYPVVPQAAASFYQPLADLTSGAVTAYTDDIGQAADVTMNKLGSQPAAFLKIGEYIASPGQEITFDASDSYTLDDSTIVKYDWDFDGDAVFDQTTTVPSVDHTYTERGDGIMQMRITTSSGRVANASAKVKIGTYTPPVLPKALQGLAVTVLETHGNTSTVRLTWDQLDDDQTGSLALMVNGIALGTMDSARTSIDITDVDRSDDVEFGIAGVRNDPNDLAVGDPAIATLLKPQPPLALDTHSDVATVYRSPTVVTAVVAPTAVSLAAIDTTSVLGEQAGRSDDFAPTGKHIVTTMAPLINHQNTMPWYVYAAAPIAGGVFLVWRVYRHTRRSSH